MGNLITEWKSKKAFNFVGYPNAILRSTLVSNKSVYYDLGFLTGPNGFSVSFSNNVSVVKTTSSTSLQRHSPSAGRIMLSGILVDSNGVPEKLNFIDRYKKIFEDQRASDGSYHSVYFHSITVEGATYYGRVSGVSLSKGPQLYSATSYQLAFEFWDFKVNNNPTVSNEAKSITGGTAPIQKLPSNAGKDLFKDAQKIKDYTAIGFYDSGKNTISDIIHRAYYSGNAEDIDSYLENQGKGPPPEWYIDLVVSMVIASKVAEQNGLPKPKTFGDISEILSLDSAIAEMAVKTVESERELSRNYAERKARPVINPNEETAATEVIVTDGTLYYKSTPISFHGDRDGSIILELRDLYDQVEKE